MKKIWIASWLATLALMLGGAATAGAATIDVNIYSGVDGGSAGEPYTGLVGHFDSPDIQFATNTGYAWHPFGLGDFGADMFGAINVPVAGIHTFSLNSDDGSELFIDGGLVINNGGAHGPTIVMASPFLTAGAHSIEVRFFECCLGESGVDLNLPTDVTFASTPSSVPEPASMVLLGTGLVALARRRYRIV